VEFKASESSGGGEVAVRAARPGEAPSAWFLDAWVRVNEGLARRGTCVQDA
jgi:hypothetical protein